MTPEQITEAQLHLSHMQLWVTGLALFFGPLLGVMFTFWFQSRKDKIEAKRKVFLSLMSSRKSLIVSYETAKALNSIDVVFADNKEIKNLWHKYYTLLSQTAGEERVHAWLELLEAMSKDLHYPSLSQVDLDKFYIPQGHADDLEYHRRTSEEWLRVLENTEHFLAVARKQEHNQEQ